MKVTLREILLVVLVIIPIAQLYYAWPSIPDVIPVHYGLNGKPDRFDDKSLLIWIIPLALLLMYGMLALVPRIDPKKRVSYVQGGYYTVRLAITIFLSIIFISYILSLSGTWNFSGSITLIMMSFIIVLGNYMPTLKPNYFIGVRTPWTLESEQVWAKTHRFSGRLWVVVGLIGFAVQMIWPSSTLLFSVAIVMLLALSSVLYSYWAYRNK